ncbi:hypothetical protein HYALB_00007372 [Hymenoscyphus albidus]|uniref:Uncharacterized protein n=1 Tax=Hymenoscyphus albidus TaxID=595503 RepID=A0A9N9LFD9_9HELO|nr:hypothetical protein HYALB_00007372 [Hymenoscyphus albidus]
MATPSLPIKTPLKGILKQSQCIPQVIQDLRKELDDYTVELPMIPLLLDCEDAPGIGILAVIRRPISELSPEILRVLPSIVALRHQFSKDWSESSDMDSDWDSDIDSDGELFDTNTSQQTRRLSTPPTEQSSFVTCPETIQEAATPRKTVQWNNTVCFNDKPTTQKPVHFHKLNYLKAVSLPLNISDLPPALRNEINILLADSPTTTKLEDLFVLMNVQDEDAFWRKKRRCDQAVKLQRLARNAEGCFDDEDDESDDETEEEDITYVDPESDQESEEGFKSRMSTIYEEQEEDDFGIVFEHDEEDIPLAEPVYGESFSDAERNRCTDGACD